MKAALLCFALGCLAAPAVPGSENAPVIVVKTQVTAQTPNPQLLVRLKNQSTKAVEAISVVVEYFDERGDSRGTVTLSECADMLANSQLAGPGAEWELNPSQLPLGAEPGRGSYRARIDFVRFRDGTEWGPDEAKESLRFTGIRSGVAATRQYLKTLLRQRGVEAVIQELER